MLRRSAFEGRTEERRVAQQRLFRVFQALSRQDTAQADKYFADGVQLDVPFILDDSNPEAVPGAASWRPAGGEALNSVTLLGWAAAHGDFDSASWLLRHGAEASQTFSGNYDAAWLAMEQGQDEMHRMLMERGAAPGLRLKDAVGTTRLMAAVKLSNVAAVRHIVSRKVNVNTPDKNGRIALHYNLEKDPYGDDDAEIGRLLLDAGANPNAEDLDGIPPHVLTEAPVALSLLQGMELRKASMEAMIALEKKRQAEMQPEEPEIEEPVIPMPKMPRQGPRRL